MTSERPGESGISVDPEELLPSNSHITLEEFLDIAEEVDSLYELTREARLQRETCRRLLRYFEKRDEVKQGFGFIREERDDRPL
ncbi:hypothetical protein BRC82_09980 [Halobacteriales archaeon QS_1_67_19]|nr:MAG: hypothetical protein BRC82_09980 [Halobacteriales archaeon QS_1_67_19]